MSHVSISFHLSVLMASHSIRSTSRNFSLALWVRTGSNISWQSSILHSTSGSTRYPIIVRPLPLRVSAARSSLRPVKWDTTGQNFRELVWFLQSASLYSHYYHLQILVHRPFIPSPRKPSPLSFPSLAICTNAARSCAHVVDLQRRRAPQYPSSHFQARICFVYVTC